jgi:predicted amidohydrolase YtcJ
MIPITLACSSDADKADIIFTNGNIYTVDEQFSKASIIAVKGSRILHTGNDIAEAEQWKSPATRIIDLEGRTVIPGIIESHVHFFDLGTSIAQPDIYEKPKEDILNIISNETRKHKPGEWIVASGWSHEVWPDAQWPTKEELDAVSPDNPVCLFRKDGHSVWVNSKALELAGITDATPDPQGGELIRTKSGRLTGVLVDTAMDELVADIPALTPQQRLEIYKLADSDMLRLGITSLVDAGVSCADIELLTEAYRNGHLHVRACELLNEGADVEYIASGKLPQRDLFDGKLSVSGVKLYTDGSLGSRSAWFLHEYEDRHGHLGNSRYSDAEFLDIVRRVRKNGFQIATHAIGDAAVRQTLDAYEKVLAEEPLADPRYRIEHFQHVQPDDIVRAAKNGVIASMQTIHATSDMPFAETRVGPDRILGAYAWRTMLDNGGIIANGSDAPVEPVNPFFGFYAAITRQNQQGIPQDGWYPQLCMSREEALKSYTIWGAYAMFAETDKGSIEAGKYADFTILDRDIMTCNAADIFNTKVLCTVIGGQTVFNSESEN